MGLRKKIKVICGECGKGRHLPLIHCKAENCYSTSHGSEMPIPKVCLYYDPDRGDNPTPKWEIIRI
jgi:hypothetical protein